MPGLFPSRSSRLHISWYQQSLPRLSSLQALDLLLPVPQTLPPEAQAIDLKRRENRLRDLPSQFDNRPDPVLIIPDLIGPGGISMYVRRAMVE